MKRNQNDTIDIFVNDSPFPEDTLDRKQVRDGAELLLNLLPVLIDTMMSNPHEDWGTPYHPVVD